MKLEFLIIDPQNDFIDPNGALCVANADKDAERLAKCMSRLLPKISDIHCSLDSHHFVDIAHPIWWVDKNGKHPNPFTLITEDDVLSGLYRTFNPKYQQRSFDYVQTLKQNGRYVLCVWPPHCLISKPGGNVFEPISKVFDDWERQFAMVDFVTKGSNPFTEHYSIVQADVPDPNDPSTQLNIDLIQTLEQADIIALSGQALSHCVANTIRDIANNFGDDNIQKMHLLIDTTSPVTGFENLADDFLHEMTGRGMNVVAADDFLR